MIKQILLQNKWLVIFASLLGAATSLFSLYLIMMVNSSLNLDYAKVSGLVVPFALSLAGLFCFGVLSQFMLTKLSSKLVAYLRTCISKWTLLSTYQQVEKAGAARIYTALTADITKLSQGFAVFPVLLFNMATIVVCLGYLCFLSPSLFGFLILILVFAVGCAHLIMKVGLGVAAESRDMEEALFKSFRSMVEGNREYSLKWQQRDFLLDRRLDAEVDKARRLEEKAQLYWNISVNWTNLILFLSLAVLVVISKLFLAVDNIVLASFIFVLVYISGAIGYVMTSSQVLARAFISLRKIDDLGLASETWSGKSKDAPVPPPGKIEKLEIKGLRYGYDASDGGESFTIGPIDFSIREGECVFIVGGNGSGKTTFIKNLLGLYSIGAGTVALNGVQVGPKNIDWYRGHFETIFNDCHLFEQILDQEGRPADDDVIRPYLEQLDLYGKVATRNGRLSTTEVSSGQRKRLALVQALVSDVPIVIFDEWAAEQDPHFRAVFYREILPQLKKKKKTVIAISHDDAYFDVADRIVKFDRGHASEIEADDLGGFYTGDLFKRRGRARAGSGSEPGNSFHGELVRSGQI